MWKESEPVLWLCSGQRLPMLADPPIREQRRRGEPVHFITDVLM